MADTSRYFGIGLDTTQLKKQAEEARKAFGRIGEEALRQAKTMDQAFSGQIIPPAFEKDIQRLSKLSIDAFGSLSDTARKAITEIQEDILSLSNLEKMMQRLDQSCEDVEIATKDYLNAQARLSVLHEQITASIRQQEQALKRDTAQMAAAGDSITSMQAKVALLTAEYMKLSAAQRDSMEGEGILKQMSDLQSKLDAAQASMNKFGMAGRTQFNMLGMSMQQIVRELPSLAMGPQMFFLAISNNLPIFTDALAQARKEYQLLTAAGKTAVPVWKQVMKSLLSWQTALSALPAILIVFGPQIAEFFQSFFTGKEKIDHAREALKQFNDTMLKGEQNAQDELARLELLYEAATDTTKSTEERKRATDEMQRLYPSYLANLEDEAIMAGNAGEAYDKLRQSILAAAKAQAALETLKENEKQLISLNAQLELASKNLDAAKRMQELQQAGNIRNTAGSAFTPIVAGSKELGDAAAEVKKYEDQITGLDNKIKTIEAGNQKLKDSININDLLFGSNGDGGSPGGAKQVEDYLSQLLDLRRDNEDRQIDLMKEGTDKQLAEINLRHDRELQAVKKLRAELEQAQGGQLTTKQASTFDAAVAGIEAGRRRDTREVRQRQIREQEAAWNEYLQKYGTFRQREQAIREEYTQRIDNSRTAGEASILQKQMEEALSALDMERLQKSMNWELIFGDLSKVSKAELDKVKNQLEAFRDSSGYKKMSVDQKKVIDEALSDIKSTMIENGGLLGDLPGQLSELREAQNELTAAQDEYNEALKNGTEAEKESALDKRNSAQNKVAVAQRNVGTASDKAIRSITTLGQAISGLGSASEMSMSDMGNMVQQVASLFGEMGSKVGGIIGAALSLIGTIQEQGLGNFLKNMGKMGNDLARETSEFFTFGLIDFGGDSDENLEADIERLTASNQELENAIANLADKMDEAAVADASGIYEQQRENLEQMMKNTQEMMQRSAAAYSNGFLGMGGTHSSGNRIDEGMSAADWLAISEVVGRTIDSAGDFFNLTSEEMWRVASEATTEYAKLKDLADNGYKDAAQFMDDYIEYWKELEELQDAYNEKLTSVSFDTIKDDFRNALLDMEDSTEAFAGNFEKMMQNAILESMMTGTYDKALKDWYQDFADSMKDGSLDTNEQDALRQQWQDIVDDASKEWQEWHDLMGWDTDNESQQQSASAGYSTTMSQDTGDALLGRATAMYECGLQIAEKIDIGNVNLEAVKNHVAETRDIIQSCYGELVQISENTGAIIKPIQQMQKDIEQVKNNTSRI